jgi:anti-sigma regulatory factor (Ser/Thr protein kinase)
MSHDLHGDVTVQLDLADHIPDVSGDAEQLQQVLINLILNAAEAMHRRGEIFISTSKSGEKLDPALFGLEGAHGFVEIRVRDTGPGIAPQNRENLFIPFFTTKDHGTGLGLALCQRIVQHHGGHIEVRSVVGQGATFILRLPANPLAANAPADRSRTTAGSGVIAASAHAQVSARSEASDSDEQTSEKQSAEEQSAEERHDPAPRGDAKKTLPLDGSRELP